METRVVFSSEIALGLSKGYHLPAMEMYFLIVHRRLYDSFGSEICMGCTVPLFLSLEMNDGNLVCFLWLFSAEPVHFVGVSSADISSIVKWHHWYLIYWVENLCSYLISGSMSVFWANTVYGHNHLVLPTFACSITDFLVILGCVHHYKPCLLI